MDSRSNASFTVFLINVINFSSIFVHKETKSCLKIYQITASHFPLDFLLLQVVYQFMHIDVKMYLIFFSFLLFTNIDL